MILCCGEALIDMLPRIATDGAAAFAPVPGGSVFNTAIALGRLGAPAGYCGGLSTDLFGRMLTGALADSGVDATPAVRSDRPTTLAFLRLEGGQAEYAFYDENTAGRMIDAADLVVPDAATALFFGGISLVVDPCGAAFADLARRAGADAGRVVMLDPNIRANFITDEPGYRARLDAMIAGTDIVKVSDDDLRWIVGPGEIDVLARAMLRRDATDRGPRLVCVTRGAAGATGYTARGSVSVAARPVVVADTVGAGDTFNAGVLAALHGAGALSRAALADLPDEVAAAALDLGSRAAAVTVSRAGANPPWLAEL